MGRKNENIVTSNDVQFLEFYLNKLKDEKRFNETDEGFIKLGEQIILEHFNGLDGFDLFMLNHTAHDTYDVFRYKNASTTRAKEQEEYLVKELQMKLAIVAEKYPEFENLSEVFNQKVDANIMVLLNEPAFVKTMGSICRLIKGKISTLLDALSKDKTDYRKPSEPVVTDIAKMIIDIDNQNYKRSDQDEIDLALDKAQVDVEELVGPFDEKKYSPFTYGKLKSVAIDQVCALYGKNYFETPDEWSKNRVVRW
jgi:hypothetical protein